MLKDIKNTLNALFKNEEGQGMVEYILIVIIIAIAAIVAFRFISKAVKHKASEVATSLMVQ